VVTTELPSDDQVFVLPHRVRPFVLENEDTSFHRVANTSDRRANNALIRTFLRAQKNLFASKLSQQGVRILLNDVLINCEASLKQWLKQWLNA
jgi:hypothetical protein